MDTKIFLQGFDSKVSSNTSEGLNVGFKGKRKLLPLNDVAEVISQYDLYREEREKCNIIRLTCQVNPICSNVLFNRITEVVKHEGCSGVSYLNYGIYGEDPNNPCEYSAYTDNTLFCGVVYKPNRTDSQPRAMEFWSGGTMNYQGHDDDIRDFDSNNTIFTALTQFKTHSTAKTVSNTDYHPTNAIRDTQLSNEVTDFKYHCGLDIFNNHLIRSNTFKTVCKLPEDYDPASAYTEYAYHGFNTIVDLMRDVRGDKVVEKICFPPIVPVENHARLVALHLYEYDDLYTFKECIQNRLIPKYNGWVGFENRSKIKSYLDFSGDTEMELERPLMYMAGGDFVDMYPGRDLYKFSPIYNIYRKRIEKNWNYCITYPSSSFTPSTSSDPFTDIIEHTDGINSMKTIYFDENTRADNGTTQLVMYSIAKHGLAQGDYVNIYRTYTSYRYWVIDENGERISDYFDYESEAEDELKRLEEESKMALDCGETKVVVPADIAQTDEPVKINTKIIDNAEVSEIVDDYIFTVFNSSTQISKNWVNLTKNELEGNVNLQAVVDKTLNTYILDKQSKKYFQKKIGSSLNLSEEKYYIVNNAYVNIDDTAQNISYKKVVNDIECEYYIRVFSKLPNFKNASADTSNEYQLYKDNEKIIHEYQDKKYDFESHASRLAFAKNIYTDEVGEVVFTDDIDISNLHDNLGRPLTSLYMTIIKNNKGYKEWYGYNYKDQDWDVYQISGDTVEFSHAFGKITCGIKTSDESIYDKDINCINRINNIGDYGYPVGYAVGGFVNESGRTYQTEDNKNIEIPDEEIWYDTDKQFWGDLCYYDNYNAVERHVDYIMHRFNTAQRECVKSESNDYFKKFYYDEIKYDDYDSSEEYSINVFDSTKEFGTACNNKKEGYYYIPHYEIPIKTFDKLQTMMPDFLTIRQFVKIEDGKPNTYRFTTLQQHFLSIGDKAVLFDTIQDKYYNLITISGGSEDNYRVFTCSVYDEKTGNPSESGITYVTEGSGEKTYHTIENLSTSATMDSISISDFKLFKMDNLGCPSYCRILKDGTCRVIWRDVLNNGFNMSDDTVEEYPFTNGAFYVNRRIDMYVRRQDPHNIYKLYDEVDIEGNKTDFSTEDNYIKEAEIEC